LIAVLQFDAASFAVVDRMLDEGRLPYARDRSVREPPAAALARDVRLRLAVRRSRRAAALVAAARVLPDRTALELTARLELRGIDWTTTQAFCSDPARRRPRHRRACGCPSARCDASRAASRGHRQHDRGCMRGRRRRTGGESLLTARR
jgi:hypothetical protein